MTARKKDVAISSPIGTVLPDAAEETTEEKQPAKTRRAAKAVDPEPEEIAPEQEQKTPVVYLGPTIDRVVNHGTVFEGGEIPAAVKAKIEEVAAIANLIAPVDKYAEVAEAIKQPTGLYNFLYRAIKEQTRE